MASDPPIGKGSNYNTRCILPLPIIPSNFSSLRSLEAEKRFPEIIGGFVYLGHTFVYLVPIFLGGWVRRFCQILFSGEGGTISSKNELF